MSLQDNKALIHLKHTDTNNSKKLIQTIKNIHCRRTVLKVDPAKEKCNATKVTILAIADTNVKKKRLK